MRGGQGCPEFVHFAAHLRALGAIRVIRSGKTGCMTPVLSVLQRTLLNQDAKHCAYHYRASPFTLG
jgi:pyruvate/2-oxoacid:ferredoxin oxidoreductase beta subunit